MKRYTLANTLLSALTAGLAISLAVEHQARLRLTREHQALEQQLDQMASLVARNEQWSNRLAQSSAPEPLPPDQLMELLRLRGETAVLDRQQHAFEQARVENRQVHAVLESCLKTLSETNATATADYWPQNSWTNCGYTSPEEALQSILWAGYNGDVTNFLAHIETNGAQEDWAQNFRGKSEIEASIRLEDETYNLKSVQILDREAEGNNTLVFTVELEEANDFQTVKMVMRKTGGEWKFAGPAQ